MSAQKRLQLEDLHPNSVVDLESEVKKTITHSTVVGPLPNPNALIPGSRGEPVSRQRKDCFDV